MKLIVISFFVVGWLLRSATAFPAPAPTNDPNFAGNARAQNRNKCTLFDPPDLKTSTMQCQDVCGEAVAKSVAAGEMASVTCYAFGDIKWENLGGT